MFSTDAAAPGYLMISSGSMLVGKEDCYGMYKLATAKVNGFDSWVRQPTSGPQRFLFRSATSNNWIIGGVSGVDSSVEMRTEFSSLWPHSPKLLWGYTDTDGGVFYDMNMMAAEDRECRYFLSQSGF